MLRRSRPRSVRCARPDATAPPTMSTIRRGRHSPPTGPSSRASAPQHPLVSERSIARWHGWMPDVTERARDAASRSAPVVSTPDRLRTTASTAPSGSTSADQSAPAVIEANGVLPPSADAPSPVTVSADGSGRHTMGRRIPEDHSAMTTLSFDAQVDPHHSMVAARKRERARQPRERVGGNRPEHARIPHRQVA